MSVPAVRSAGILLPAPFQADLKVRRYVARFTPAFAAGRQARAVAGRLHGPPALPHHGRADAVDAPVESGTSNRIMPS
jgi:hypothetical protein